MRTGLLLFRTYRRPTPGSVKLSVFLGYLTFLCLPVQSDGRIMSGRDPIVKDACRQEKVVAIKIREEEQGMNIRLDQGSPNTHPSFQTLLHCLISPNQVYTTLILNPVPSLGSPRST